MEIKTYHSLTLQPSKTNLSTRLTTGTSPHINNFLTAQILLVFSSTLTEQRGAGKPTSYMSYARDYVLWQHSTVNLILFVSLPVRCCCHQHTWSNNSLGPPNSDMRIQHSGQWKTCVFANILGWHLFHYHRRKIYAWAANLGPD